MSLTVLFVIFLVVVLFIFYLNKGKFLADVQAMRANTSSNDLQRIDYDDLKHLPSPVQRYIKFALPEGYPVIRFVKLTHSGKFRPAVNKDWVKIKGVQYFSTRMPGFIWKGKTLFFTAEDRFFPDHGRLQVYLLSLIPILNSSGDKTDISELQRWIAEQFWFPTNLLNSSLFTWTPIDDSSATLTLHFLEYTIPVIVDFHEDGRILSVSCQRYLNKGNPEKWIGRAEKYKKINGIMVPARVTATWLLPEGEFTYADFLVNSIDYEPKPELKDHEFESIVLQEAVG